MKWIIKYGRLNSYWKGVALMLVGFLLSLAVFLLGYLFGFQFMSSINYVAVLLMFVGMILVGKYFVSGEATDEYKNELGKLKSKQPWE